ncbi:MAG: hypothetical protein WCQ26_05140 [Pseudanabaena sp. ELA748]
MVAKRNLDPQVPSQTLRSQGRQYGPHDVVNINSRSSRSTSGNNISVPNVNGYSDSVARNVQRKKEQFCRGKATESIIVIAVNVALSCAAIVAIAKLLPYQSSQKDRLDELTTEVTSAEQRVNGLREKLPEMFNSGKSQETLLRKQGWIKNNQMTIKLLDPSEIAAPTNDAIMLTTTAQKANKNP